MKQIKKIDDIDYCRIFPSIENFRKSLSNNISKENCIEQIEKLHQDCPIEEIVNLSIERLIQDIESKELKGNYNNHMLLDEDDFELNIHCSFEKPKDFVGSVMYSHVQDIIFCPIIDTGAYYKIYKQNLTNDPAVLKETFTIEPFLEKKQSPGKAIYIEKFKDILYLDKHKPFVSLVLKIKANPLAYSWEYDAISLKPNRIALADTNVGRLETSLKILAQIGNESSVHILAKFAKSPVHTIRWESARALINVDYDMGLSILEDMAVHETHGEVKKAAMQSLEILKQLN